MARCRRRLLWMIRRQVRRHRRSRELSASGKMRYKRKKAKPEILKHGGNGGKSEDFGGCNDERTFSCDCESRVGFATYPLKILRFLRFSSVSSVFQRFLVLLLVLFFYGFSAGSSANPAQIKALKAELSLMGRGLSIC